MRPERSKNASGREETTDGEGIQAAGDDRFQEEGLAWQAPEQGESGRELRKPVQGCGPGDGAGPGSLIPSPLNVD